MNLKSIMLIYNVYQIFINIYMVYKVFIVLRKKNESISLLHLYHHVGMVLFSWTMLKYFISEQLFIIITINSFVHVAMYTYYFLSILGPSVQKYLWWKKCITLLQLIQFVFFIGYEVVIMAKGCPQNRGVSMFVLVQGSIFFKLFKDFYIQQYVRKSESKIEQNNATKIKQS